MGSLTLQQLHKRSLLLGPVKVCVWAQFPNILGGPWPSAVQNRWPVLYTHVRGANAHWMTIDKGRQWQRRRRCDRTLATTWSTDLATKISLRQVSEKRCAIAVHLGIRRRRCPIKRAKEDSLTSKIQETEKERKKMSKTRKITKGYASLFQMVEEICS